MARLRPGGICAPCTAVKYDAAPTGSAISRGLPSPASRAASTSRLRRRSPHRAGWVSRTSSAGAPSWRRASPATCARTWLNTCGTGSSASPSRIVPSSMRRFGFGSNRPGSSRACRSASRPTSIRPSVFRYTADGSSGEPSNSSGRIRPSGVRSMATVFDVPKSMASTRMSATLLGGAGRRCRPAARHNPAVSYQYLDAPVPLAFAHRGGAAVGIPGGAENTAEAFARAVAMGYRYVETDTHATADGIAVVFHDTTLDRMLGRAGRVRDVRWADLATVRVGGAAVGPRLDAAPDARPGV